MYTAFQKCAIHSTLQWFFFFFPPLLGTEVKTPVDSSPYLIGWVALNQPVMELMAVCHPWRYKFPGGVSSRQCMKCGLCASKDWSAAEGQGASLARSGAGLPSCQAPELVPPETWTMPVGKASMSFFTASGARLLSPSFAEEGLPIWGSYSALKGSRPGPIQCVNPAALSTRQLVFAFKFRNWERGL